MLLWAFGNDSPVEYFKGVTAHSLLSDSELYFLLGVIELTLRERIPATLSSDDSGNSWIEVISRDAYRHHELNQALNRNATNIPDSVTFHCKEFHQNLGKKFGDIVSTAL